MTTYAYLNAGFGDPLGIERCEYIHSLGFTGIRTDLKPDNWKVVVDELAEFGKLSPIFLFGGGDMSGWIPETFYDMTVGVAKWIKKGEYFSNLPIFFEIGNEPDIAVPMWKDHPAYLADTFWECYRYTKSACGRIDLITGGISNLNSRGLDWFEQYMLSTVQDNAIVGFHRYPNGSETPIPHDGFPSREHEWNRLRTLTDGRRVFCTETGLSTGPHRQAKRFPLCWLYNKVYITEEQQGEAFETEYNFYTRRNALGMVWYQHKDGANRNNLLDNYGILHENETEKAHVCDVIRSTLL